MSALHLLGDTDDATGRTRTRVTSLLALVIAALAQIVGTSVDDDCTLDRTVSSYSIKMNREGNGKVYIT